MSDGGNPNFDRWFGGSKVVDDEGRPRVVYHSTFNEFSAFEKTRDVGFHFGSAYAADKRIDEAAKGRARGMAKYDGVYIKPVYLSIKNPVHLESDPGAWNPNYVVKLLEHVIPKADQDRLLEMDASALRLAQKESARMRDAGIGTITRTNRWGDVRVEMIQRVWCKILSEHQKDVYAEIKKSIINAGFDGLSYLNEVEGAGRSKVARKKNPENMTWVAFDPRQVKSIWNSGDFNPENPDLSDRRINSADEAREYLRSLTKQAAPHA